MTTSTARIIEAARKRDADPVARAARIASLIKMVKEAQGRFEERASRQAMSEKDWARVYEL